jgi:hypothetical protein
MGSADRVAHLPSLGINSPMADFTTVFIFTDKSGRILGEARGELLPGIFFFIVAIALVLRAVTTKMIRSKGAVTGHLIMAVLLAYFSIGWLYNSYERLQRLTSEYNNLTQIYLEERYKIAEGVVRVLHTQPASGHDAGDIITVGGIEIEVNYFSNTFGYNQTIAHGGNLTDGVYAKIYYHKDETRNTQSITILRIDLKKAPVLNFKYHLKVVKTKELICGATDVPSIRVVAQPCVAGVILLQNADR